MNIAFRADASLQIGTGHVMRCLTLAEALRERGCECLFICREHPGNMIEGIQRRGFSVAVLPWREDVKCKELVLKERLPVHAGWLGCDWQTDARQCSEILSGFKPDWLVADHYALDQRWEEAVRGHARHLLVIDDLADRPHTCDLLLDQNLGRTKEDYQGLVPVDCDLMIGPRYALLRPEFARLRDYSLKRRVNPQIRQLLITMGGIDKDNATGMVLEALKGCRLPEDCRVDVVMGGNAPWLAKVREIALQLPWPTEVSVNVTDMAQRMADADLAIGAAGSTSWERCCLGLPTIVVVLAENQWSAAQALKKKGAAVVADSSCMVDTVLSNLLVGENIVAILRAMTKVCVDTVDGFGCHMVSEKLNMRS